MKDADKWLRGLNNKPVGQFTLDGELVAYHGSVLAAAKATGVLYSSIAAALIEKRAMAGGFIWADNPQHARVRAETRKAAVKKRSQAAPGSRCKAVIQFTLSGKKIAVYTSTGEAARQTGIHPSSIGQAARGEMVHAGGFLWRYVDHL
ncbi:TPA: NUMOD1 domain-containing DNA-binding protein [Klebsiella pneumoniae]